jgi:hypothetical protein
VIATARWVSGAAREASAQPILGSKDMGSRDTGSKDTIKLLCFS